MFHEIHFPESMVNFRRLKGYSILLLIFIFFACQPDVSEPKFVLIKYPAKTVQKSNSIKLYTRYMPWFQSKPFDG